MNNGTSINNKMYRFWSKFYSFFAMMIHHIQSRHTFVILIYLNAKLSSQFTFNSNQTMSKMTKYKPNESKFQFNFPLYGYFLDMLTALNASSWQLFISFKELKNILIDIKEKRLEKCKIKHQKFKFFFVKKWFGFIEIVHRMSQYKSDGKLELWF